MTLEERVAPIVSGYPNLRLSADRPRNDPRVEGLDVYALHAEGADDSSIDRICRIASRKGEALGRNMVVFFHSSGAPERVEIETQAAEKQ